MPNQKLDYDHLQTGDVIYSDGSIVPAGPLTVEERHGEHVVRTSARGNPGSPGFFWLREATDDVTGLLDGFTRTANKGVAA